MHHLEPMQFDHIVVAVDFSESARAAVRAAARFAGDTRLTLVHVWQAAVAQHEATLAAWMQEASELGATNVASIVLAGNAADEILELAHQDPSIDLIVVGTHGRSPLIGSVAEKIVRRSPCAVLAVRNAGVDAARRSRQPAALSIH